MSQSSIFFTLSEVYFLFDNECGVGYSLGIFTQLSIWFQLKISASDLIKVLCYVPLLFRSNMLPFRCFCFKVFHSTFFVSDHLLNLLNFKTILSDYYIWDRHVVLLTFKNCCDMHYLFSYQVWLTFWAQDKMIRAFKMVSYILWCTLLWHLKNVLHTPLYYRVSMTSPIILISLWYCLPVW